MHKILYIDTETTGLKPEYNSIWQIGAIMEIDGKVVGNFNEKMSPCPGKAINMDADLTGRNFAFLSNLQPADTAYKKFKAWLKEHVNPYDKQDKLVFVGYNANFDYQFMRQWFLDMNDKFFGSWFWFPYIDVMQLAGYVLLSLNVRAGMHNFKLQTVVEALNIDISDITFHDAFDDIVVTQRLYKFISKKMEIINT